MIKINIIQIQGVNIPEIELTSEEKETIIFTLFDGINANYYQEGDELPQIQETE